MEELAGSIRISVELYNANKLQKKQDLKEGNRN
jgi:hypothetical protein